jgi:hypothetical protein
VRIRLRACLSGSGARLWARGRVGEDKDHQRTVTTPTVWRATCFPRGSPAGGVPDIDVIYSAITAPGVETRRKVCDRFTSTTSTYSSAQYTCQELQLCTHTSSNAPSWQIFSIHQERLQRFTDVSSLQSWESDAPNLLSAISTSRSTACMPRLTMKLSESKPANESTS